MKQALIFIHLSINAFDLFVLKTYSADASSSTLALMLIIRKIDSQLSPHVRINLFSMLVRALVGVLL